MKRDIFPMPSGGRRVRHCLASCAAGIIAVTLLLVPSTKAFADEYDDQRAVAAQIDNQQGALAEADAALLKASADSANAQAAWESAKGELVNAQSVLAAAVAARTEAASLNETRTRELADAQASLAQARDEVAKGKAEVDAERLSIGGIGRSVVQQGAPLAAVSAMLAAKTTSELGRIEQWNDQMMQIHTSAMERLQSKLDNLRKVEDTQAKAENAANAAKEAAAKTLADCQNAESAALSATSIAANAEQNVANAANIAASAAANASAMADSERARMASLEAERSNVEQRIQARLAREAAANNGGGEYVPPAPVVTGGSTFMMPVDGVFTSAFGMRLHPVVGIWVLHDGTDWGASCGSPIRAAAAGVVTDNYWDTTGFGNRLIIDHGRINGTALTTGYNHAQGFIVGVGQWVEKGQIIGYVGTTGYSTGCHLHLNLWVNGSIHDPQDGWF